MDATTTIAAEISSPLLNDFVDGAVDYKNRPVLRSKSGVEVAERFAYFGVSSNLILYLTGSLGQSTATAAKNINAWSGTALLLPLVGAFIADAYRPTVALLNLVFALDVRPN
ncbi:proton-dependent oligopeptide transporter family protein [Tanacetum coccineum]